MRLHTPWLNSFTKAKSTTLEVSLFPGDVNQDNDMKTMTVTVENKGKDKGKDKDK